MVQLIDTCVLFLVSCLSIIFDGAQSCYCDDFYFFECKLSLFQSTCFDYHFIPLFTVTFGKYFSGTIKSTHITTAVNDTGTRNISLVGSVYLSFDGCCLDHCDELELHWEIQRADGMREVYTVFEHNKTYNYQRHEEIPDRGLKFYGTQMTISPTDQRYNGAKITGILDLPECYNNSNVTEPLTIIIQGVIIMCLKIR